jgi:hypothetical protein
MPDRLTAVGFDWDAASLSSLREALPGWETGVVDGATAASPSHGGDPAAADLLGVKAREKSAELKTAGGPATGKDDPKERPECVASKKWARLVCGRWLRDRSFTPRRGYFP